MRVLDPGQLLDNVGVVRGEVADAGEVDQSLVVVVSLDKVARRLDLEEREDEDEAGEYDVQTSRYELGKC